MSSSVSLVWFRRDLRTLDNPALTEALNAGRAVAGVYILDETRHFSPGAAQKWFIHHALVELGAALGRLGVPLLLRRGPEAKTLTEIATELDAAAVYWNRRYAAEEITIDTAVKENLGKTGKEAFSFNGSLLREPWQIETKTGGPYKVYTPFWKAMLGLGPSRAAPPAPSKLKTAEKINLTSDDPATLGLLPHAPDWASEFGDLWTPGEKGAARALRNFLENAATDYADNRNRPDLAGTSRLSPHLAVGTISPLTIWDATHHAMNAGDIPESQGLKFLSELCWREFAYHLLYHFPDLPHEPWRKEFGAFPWRKDEEAFRAWTRGETGVPMVDAGMRELWRTGWMHNRVRMIVASFLVKNCLIDWRKGERWFWDTLVDADPANNTASWQWVAGSGADAAPYFRIFNPVSQGVKFDPCGDYVRTYVEEISAFPNDVVHEPWTRADAKSPEKYPRPIVDLGATRKRALAAYDEMKKIAG